MTLAEWRSLREPTSRWRKEARAVIRNVVDRNHIKPDPQSLLALVDAHYPFGPRSHTPYKAWLEERKLIKQALGLGPLGPVELPAPNRDEVFACEVAHDLVELGRIDEARKLLEERAPNRLNRECPACGLPVGFDCQDIDDRYSTVRHVPHLARVQSPQPVAPGPLFGEP